MLQSTTERPDAVEARTAYAERLNWLRAGVLGANDGIVSIAGTTVGVAAATTNATAIMIAAIAAVSAGALSMAVGEYVSVSSQKDSEQAVVNRVRRSLRTDPESGFERLVEVHMDHGLSESTARLVATEQTANDPITAHAQVEHGITPGHLTSPLHAAIASLLAFLVGGTLPALATTLTPVGLRIPFTFVVVVIALIVTGAISAHLGNAPKLRAILRNVAGGSIAMAITYAIGTLVGAGVSF